MALTPKTFPKPFSVYANTGEKMADEFRCGLEDYTL
jgi:hypothetical protein